MSQFTVMTYNIKWMNRMFKNGQIKPEKQTQAERVAEVILRRQPHILGICEAANQPEEHAYFIQNYLNGSYQLAVGASRGGQNLVFYYRHPVQLMAVDDAFGTYNPWLADVDDDGIQEQYRWERKPLEAVFRLGQNGPQVRLIQVHTKSKIVASVVDLHNFEKIALSNRKKLVAQAAHLRARLDQLLTEENETAVIVMGDMNDGPGMDPFEMMVGKSFVESVMGSVFEPEIIMHNTLFWMTRQTRKIRDQLWTTDFPDPIVSSPFGGKHRVWLDHILVSPDMLKANSLVRYVMDSGRIGDKDYAARRASDHYPVYCTLETD